MNIAELLKRYAKKDDKFYSLMYGESYFDSVEGDNDWMTINLRDQLSGELFSLNFDGTWNSMGECVLFPSKEQRDWNMWSKEKKEKRNFVDTLKCGDYIFDKEKGLFKVVSLDNVGVNFVKADNLLHSEPIELYVDEKRTRKVDCFDHFLLKPFDKVLVRNEVDEDWTCNYYSHYCKYRMMYKCIDGIYNYCIPYNEETEHLVGTLDDAREFYI